MTTQAQQNDPLLRAAMMARMQEAQEMAVSPDIAEMEKARLAKQQEDAAKIQQASAANTAQGGQLQQAGQAATAAGAAGANPYVAGAGVALQGIGMVDDAKRRNEQAKIDAYNQKIMAQRAAVRNIFG
jgi:hypothetical protein